MDVAVEVARHVELIRSDAGAARAICEEARSFAEERKPSFVSDGEWREAQDRWEAVAAALQPPSRQDCVRAAGRLATRAHTSSCSLRRVPTEPYIPDPFAGRVLLAPPGWEPLGYALRQIPPVRFGGGDAEPSCGAALARLERDSPGRPAFLEKAQAEPVASATAVAVHADHVPAGPQDPFDPLARPAAAAALEEGKGAPLPKLTPHSLRRTFASALGEPPPVVMQEMGHTSPSLAPAIYAQAMRRDEAEDEKLRELVDGSPMDDPAAKGRAPDPLPKSASVSVRRRPSGDDVGGDPA